VEARHVDDGWTVVQDVARSVEPNTVAGLEIPMAFGHVSPLLLGDQRLTVEPDGDQWVATLSVLVERAAVLTARLGAHVASPFEPGSPQTELRGRPGYVRVQPGVGAGTAFVTLESGLNLEISDPGNSDPMTGADLVQATNIMRIGPAPYVGWMWHR
jgi:hypothetical protein